MDMINWTVAAWVFQIVAFAVLSYRLSTLERVLRQLAVQRTPISAETRPPEPVDETTKVMSRIQFNWERDAADPTGLISRMPNIDQTDEATIRR